MTKIIMASAKIPYLRTMRIVLSIVIIFIALSCADKEEKVLETVEGVATYYAEPFHGRITKSGDIYDMNKLTAAHARFAMGTKVRVINLANQKSVTVIVNDEPRTNRKTYIDLSKAAFRQLSHLDSGVIKVKMEVLEWGKK